MSSYFDPVSGQYLQYDYRREKWTYADGTIYDPEYAGLLLFVRAMATNRD
jgi:hypothetical protein